MTKAIFRYQHFESTLHLHGVIVEVGVGSGQGLRLFMRLQEFFSDKRQIYAFDSFQGFPRGSKYDSEKFNKYSKAKYKLFTVPFVKSYLLATGASEDQVSAVRFIRGFIPESLQKFDHKPIALLNLDLDLYQPTIDALNFFWQYIVHGGIILLDDYDVDSTQKWPGVKKAVDEFCLINDLSLRQGYSGLAYIKK